MHVDILGDVFVDDFNRAIQIMPENDAEQINIKKYLQGIAQESASKGFDTEEIIKLREFLTELDRRRATNWQRVFPWLEPIFQQVDQ